MRTTPTQGDDGSDPNCPMVHQYHPELNTASQPTCMAAITAKFNRALFMEEVQKYECIYNKFSNDYKNEYISLNSWKAIAEKFGLDAPEAERSYKNCHTSCGRYLKKQKSVPSGSGRNAVPIPAEFANLEWLNNHINHHAETVTNIAAIDQFG